ncbi:MAG: N-acetyltransferase [Proteobacteria bacterium]|jgi:phosphinothricin acetyltransferase|nr:N-acetyltransferase [Pseudomonadota bacterium]
MTAIRHAGPGDLAAIVAIYNASIPGRMATADLEPVTLASREGWFEEFSPDRRPLWVACEQSPSASSGPDRNAIESVAGPPVAWLSLHSFYGRAAYDATVEVSVYCAPDRQRRGHSRALLRHALETAPSLGIATLLACVFGHNAPSLALFEGEGFVRWGILPNVARLDGARRDLVILGRGLAIGACAMDRGTIVSESDSL